MVKGDLLGDAFGVSAFHRCQVSNLLRGQLIHYNPDNPPEMAVVTSFGSPRCGVTIRELPVPVTSIKVEATAPENLAGTAAGLPLPAGSSFVTGAVRKRSDSDCEAEDVKPKLARLEDGTVIVKTSPRHRCKAGLIRTSENTKLGHPYHFGLCSSVQCIEFLSEAVRKNVWLYMHLLP